MFLCIYLAQQDEIPRFVQMSVDVFYRDVRIHAQIIVIPRFVGMGFNVFYRDVWIYAQTDRNSTVCRDGRRHVLS